MRHLRALLRELMKRRQYIVQRGTWYAARATSLHYSRLFADERGGDVKFGGEIKCGGRM